MADALYGGMATSAFPVGPTDLDSAGNVFRMRPKPGRRPAVEYVPADTSASWLKYDFLTISSIGQSVGVESATNSVERALAPDGDAGINLAGDSGPVPHYIALNAHTATSSVDANSKVAVYSVYDLQFLFRLYHATAATAGMDNSEIKLMPSVPLGATALNTDAYEWGLWEIGTGSDNYFPIVDVANLDTTNGQVKIVELDTGAGATENFAPVWVEFVGKP